MVEIFTLKDLVGGGKYHENRNISIKNSNFKNSRSNDYGGSIRVDVYKAYDCYFNIDNCTFNNCSSSAGGAISSEYNSVNNFTNSYFTNCFVNSSGWAHGGAIYLDDRVGKTYIKLCNFTNNTASSSSQYSTPGGGAIYCEGCDEQLYVENSTFFNNSAYDGGAIGAWDEHGVILKYCEFYNNSASNEGGALHLDCSYMINDVYGCTFINNSAKVSGGAIYIKDGKVTNNIIIDNSATEDGTDVIGYSRWGTVYLANNWWGSNNNPDDRINYIDNVNWVYMTFVSNETNMYVGGTYNLTSGLTHVTDGVNITEFNQYLPIRKDTFSAQTGKYSVVSSELVGNVLHTIYSLSTIDNTLYSKIDYQVLELILKPSCDLEIIKDSSSNVIVNNDKFYYYIVVTNKGFYCDENITVTDTLPDGLIFISASGNGIYNENNNTIVWKLPSLKVNESVLFKVLVQATQIGEITNSVNVSGDLFDINLTNNKDNHSVIVVDPNPNLSVIKITNVPIVYVGKQVSFTIIVKNTGNTVLKNVFVIENIPKGLVYAGFIGDGWIKNGNKFIYTGSLAVGKSANFTIFFKTTKAGNFTNVVVAGCDGVDNVTAKNTTEVVKQHKPSVNNPDKHHNDGSGDVLDNSKSINVGHATGNPILALLMVLVLIALMPLRGKK